MDLPAGVAAVLPIAVGAPGAVFLHFVAALLVGRGTPGKVAAVGASVLAFGWAFFCRGNGGPGAAFLFLGVLLLSMRLVDVISREPQPLADRLALQMLVLDPRDLKPMASTLDLRRLARLAGLLAVGVPVGLSLFRIPESGAWWALRWGLGMLFTYIGLDVIGSAFCLAFALGGMRAIPLQDRPELSRSIAEFWGKRWNREVGNWLHRWCFRPLARRGHAMLGMFAAFAYSGFFHAAAIAAGIGLRAGAPMFAFFLVHGLLVGAERALRVGRWPRWAGHLWTVSWFLVTSPLFIQPALEVVGMRPG